MRGHAIPLSVPRRLVTEHCRLAQAVPRGVLSGEVDLSPLFAARAAMLDRPPWTVIVAKALGLAARAMPALRQMHVALPTPRLYQLPHSVGAIIIERDVGGEPALFYARLKAPEDQPLAALAARVRALKSAPIESVKDFRAALRVASLPWPLRPAGFWLGRNWGRQAANFYGSFGISVVGQGGLRFTQSLSLWTSFLSYGPIVPGRPTELLLTFDHRVLDGRAVVEAFGLLREALAGPLLAELRAMAAARVAPPGPASYEPTRPPALGALL